MTWTSRLRNGLVRMINSTAPPRYEPRRPHGNSLNIMGVRTALSEAVWGEMPGLSQPVWGPEISTVGRYSQEGYTSKTFDKPIISFRSMAEALATDEDVSLAINHLSSQITGGEHYWKGKDDAMVDYMEEFSKQIDFDEMDTKIVKELLWYGNSFWKPRMGIANVRNKRDIMHIPISSAVRIWWDRQRIPYKYEFRGADYQGYHNPDEVIHLVWNPVDASAYGVGLGVSMMSTHRFEQITANGPEENQLPSLLDRKYSNQLTMHVTERRYTPRNVYVAPEADSEERSELEERLQDLKLGEDFVAGSELKVQELGSMQRAFNPTQFTDTVLGPIMKALNDFRGKQGTESSHQYANAKTSAVLDQIGLSSFPLTVTRMLIDKFFKPWYDANPQYDPSYGGGYVAVPWDSCEYELNFGRVQKKDIDLKDQIELIRLAIEIGAVQDPVEKRNLIEDAGLGLRQEYGEKIEQMLGSIDPRNQPAGGYEGIPPYEYPSFENPDSYNAYETPAYNFYNQEMGMPPNNNPMYNDMMVNVRGKRPATENNPFTPNPYSAIPSDPKLNFTEAKKRKMLRK